MRVNGILMGVVTCFVLAGCSDDADTGDEGPGGTGSGGTGTAGTGTAGTGTGGRGGTGTSGSGGGAGMCPIQSMACNTCATSGTCGGPTGACLMDAACTQAFQTVSNCICMAQRAGDQAAQQACISTFESSGMAAQGVTTCVKSNCTMPCGV